MKKNRSDEITFILVFIFLVLFELANSKVQKLIEQNVKTCFFNKLTVNYVKNELNLLIASFGFVGRSQNCLQNILGL